MAVGLHLTKGVISFTEYKYVGKFSLPAI